MDEFDDILVHYGTPRHSGRYPWGSGEKWQRNKNIISRYDEERQKGYDEKTVAKNLGYDSTNAMRKDLKIAREEAKRYEYEMVVKLKDKGMSNVAIGKRMGINESSVRNILKRGENPKTTTATNTVQILKDSLEKNEYVNVGKGVELYLGTSLETKNAALKMLKDEGYEVINLQVKQLGTGNYTTTQVLAPKGTTYKDVSSNLDKIQLPFEYLTDNGGTISSLHRPNNVNSDRIMVRYAEDGGTKKDGVIELRRGVKDLDMGNSRYAQVRIGVDGTHYLKGMAVYADDSDFPDGVDIIFNSNKARGSSKDKVFKLQKDDPDNPFGSSIDRQNDWIDSNGKKHEGALNIVREEGEWGEWKKSIASQVLSKQSLDLAKKQLGLSTAQYQEEFEEINSLTNPLVKKKMLEDFADQCDKASVDLKAAAFPRQASQVILPVNSLKDTEIYAPNYRNGEEVVLVRYPHGGIFEVPRLKVNNKNKEADSFIGRNAKDAVGINPKVAEQLSGADFDGDTVLVIPTSTVKFKNSSPLEGLKGFDPKAKYPAYDGMKRMGTKYGGPATDIEMGRISNLITDMTLKGANEDELARAVRHSMVVIDAEKHYLNYKQSYEDNGIAALKKKYQGKGGASTLISRAKHDTEIVKRSQVTKIDEKTGELIYRDARDAHFTKRITQKDGTVVEEEFTKHQKVPLMSVTKNAYDLSSGLPMEGVYASYANGMKTLANKARLASIQVQEPSIDKEAAKVYSKEVESLKNKLITVNKNAPKERQAQILANSIYNAKKNDNPGWDEDEEKKARNSALRIARERTGAARVEVTFTDREWEAIQANAVSKTTVKALLEKADKDVVRNLAMPKTKTALTPSKIALAKAMLDSGHTNSEVAERFGISVSTLNSYM